MLQTAVSQKPKAADDRICSDAELLTLIARGDNWALSEIYDRYARLVFSVALRILNDRASAEDVVQQVFTQVWRHAQDYRLERGKFTTWVITMTRHLSIDELRRRRNRPITSSGDWELFDWVAGDDDPAQSIMDQIRVSDALRRLPRQQRTVIELAFWEGMTQQEIALHCHSPLGTVKTRVRVGMQRLKLLLQESDPINEAARSELAGEG